MSPTASSPKASSPNPSPSSSALPSEVSVVVIGAGPAGIAAALSLHDQGHQVLVLERARFPRFVIGESLLPRCMDHLETLGLMEAVKARGYLAKPGALFIQDGQAAPLDFSDQHDPAHWTHTWEVPRDDFDHTIAQAAIARGVDIRFEHRVTGFVPGDRPVVEVDGQHHITARFVIDASGYGRVLPRLLAIDLPSDLPQRSVVFGHITGDRREPGPLEGRICVVVHPEACWVWVIPFANGRTSVGVVGPPGFDADRGLLEICRREPWLAARLQDATLQFERRIDSYSIAVERLYGPGWCLVGNATEFLDPVFSSGVTLAFESSLLAVPCVARVLNGQDPRWDQDYVTPMLAGVEVFRTYVEAWYDGRFRTILFADRPDPTIKRQITSVLAGYAWDPTNPWVTDHARRVATLARFLERRDAMAAPPDSPDGHG